MSHTECAQAAWLLRGHPGERGGWGQGWWEWGELGGGEGEWGAASKAFIADIKQHQASYCEAYLGCPGCLAASGVILDETSLSAAIMLVTASVLMSRVLSKSWLAAVDKMARSLGRAPIVLEFEISCTILQKWKSMTAVANADTFHCLPAFTLSHVPETRDLLHDTHEISCMTPMRTTLLLSLTLLQVVACL